MPDFFNKDAALSYDERNSKLAAISDNLHFLMRLVLADLPKEARILCVGVGTGADILALAQVYPGWRFVGVDPSLDMLDVCRERLRHQGVLSRCELIEGDVHDAPRSPQFDAVVSLLVAHFIARAERPAFYDAVRDRLKTGGRFLSAEISADLDAAAFPALLKDWTRVQALMGATAESLERLPAILQDTLAVVSPSETEALWKEAGFGAPVQFFQAFMIRGWHATKD